MTIASECVLAVELGISYAAICVVDNLANGVADVPLAVADFEAGKELNRKRLLAGLEPLVAELGASGE
jgi:purine nucleoside phosphorylase